MAGWAVLGLTLGYTAVLFAVAWRGDRLVSGPLVTTWRGYVFALSIAVYCTSWTFFGAVGTAAEAGWTYLPIYLGPILVFLAAPGLLRRMAAISKRENIVSISDFLAARYGKSRRLAAVATVAATLGVLPYIALQLKSVATSYLALARYDPAAGATPAHETVFLVALAMAVFAIVFGARTADAARPNQGLVLAIALEAVVKLVALVVVAGLAVLALTGGGPPSAAPPPPNPFLTRPPALEFVTLTVLAMVAVVCLPRQFHITMVENRDLDHLRTARWLFPAYLVVICLVAVPIALAGPRLLPPGAAPDLFVISVPLALGAEWASGLAFLGGFSAATGMIIVSSIALSNMVCNDLITPLLLRTRRFAASDADMARLLLMLRRSVIAVLLLASYVFYRASVGDQRLAEIGLMSFVAAAQFGPALIGGLYWDGARRRGAVLGLSVGGGVWLFTLVAPAVFGLEAMRAAGFSGPLDPHALFGVSGMDPITHAAVWSLAANVAAFVIGSASTRGGVDERVQAHAFAQAGGDPRSLQFAATITMGDMRALAARYLGAAAASQAFEDFCQAQDRPWRASAPVDVAAARFTQRLLAGALGASTARVVLASALSDSTVPLEDVVALLDQTGLESRFNRDLLQATLEHMAEGVAVVDADMRLVAWNAEYLRLFQFPPGFIHVGRPVAEVIRHNAERGECGPGELDDHVAKRVAYMRRGSPHAFERVRPNGRTLKTRGNPMPDGGYVMSFIDITEEKQRELELARANQRLEHRVVERTRTLARLNDELAAAKRRADEANADKTSLLAAASHDLLQPLNAARLFTGALDERLKSADPDARGLATKIDRSIRSADRLLRALLDISKLDHGGVRPDIASVDVDALLAELESEFAPVAEARTLRLARAPSGLTVLSDRTLLRTIVQNFVSNALRYTNAGGVVIGARRTGDRVRIEVWDTGPGVPDAKHREIFQAFHRLATADHGDERGAGLGLAIVDRMARLLNAEVSVRSRLGRGSVFSVTAPRAIVTSPDPNPASEPAQPDVFRGLRVLCLDDEPTAREAFHAALTAWGCEAVSAASIAEAEAAARTGAFDVIFADYHLGDGGSGLDALARLATLQPNAIALVMTADTTGTAEAAAAAAGISVIRKPLSTDTVKAVLASCAPAAAQ